MKVGLYLCLLSAMGAAGCASQLGKNAPVEPKQTDVFVSGTEGYHTFRIPALAVTRKGTILAFCEGRKSGRGDSGQIDTVLRRSTDNGKTWGPLIIAAAGGEDTLGNPCPIVERKTGTILLLLTKNLGSVKESQIMAGEAPPRTVWITRSNDDGLSWSSPEDISGQTRQSDWRWYATGPGHGIQLENGRLVAACDHSDASEHQCVYSHVIFSDDGGASWHIGGTAGEKTDESIVAELPDGSLYLNMRNNHGTHRRAVAISTDKGLTWASVTEDPALIEPVCQASVLAVPGGKGHGQASLLFSNPANVRRENMTVRVSPDNGKTWSGGRTLWAGPSAYSDLTQTADNKIGCLYERGKASAYETITMALFHPNWLAEGNKAP